ncbi:MAG TPA: right-handed parallel beta-helix repeat-containing protein [Thermoanaerobaculia bacterium]|nr:right-handed parallel beta-helix repeat-containing protein [Thermoanaerobaculia bacterium]
MLRIAPVVLSLALSFLALAQTPDLKVTMQHPDSVRLGDIATLTVTVENAGAAMAQNTRLDMRIIPGRECDRSIVLGDVAPGEKRTVTCTQEVLDFGLYYMELSAGAGSTPDEPSALRADNFVNAFVPRLTVGTDLGLYLNQLPVATKPGLPFPFQILFENRSFTPATNTTLTFTVSEGSFGPNVPRSCSVEGTRAVCRLGTLDPPVFGDFRFATIFTIDVIGPDRSEAPWSIDVELRADQGDEKPADNTQHASLMTYRTFFVREATDAALRGALHAAGDSCHGTPCLVAFRIPNGAAAKWHTIALSSPLEELRGMRYAVDGTTQAGYFGDTNPDGPEIEIDGSATAGDGLRLPGRCGITVAGLALNGFRGSALLVHDAPQACLADAGPATVQDSYIGTDPTGTRAKPNERGIVSLSGNGVSAFRNVISGNARSAVYMARGRGIIANNIIGLNRRHDAPLPNGASGVYVGPDGDGTDVNDNYIGFNAHFGVAIDRGAEHVALHGNSFQANGGLAIDWGLDGPEAGGSTRTPSIRGVRYANGVTTIEVDAQPASSFPVVNFYASDAPDPSGFGEGQYFLGTAHAPFRIEVPLDLRGKWISATLTDVHTLQIVRGNDNSNVWRTTTSELSRAVEVR